MNLNIRPIRDADIEAIYEIRIMDGVRENMLGIASEKLSRMAARLSGLTEDDHYFVAELEENGEKKIVGTINLSVNKNPRLRHSGGIGIMVHRDYQGRGIGKALFNKIIDLADNWLMLTRLELGVFTDNERAIRLYSSMGFQIEGTKRYAAVRNGAYVDEHMMARYNIK